MTERRTSRFAFPVTVVAAVLVAVLAGGLFGNRLLGSSLNNGLNHRMKEYTELLNAARYWSADDVSSEKLVYSSIDGMLRTLDPHTTFLEPRAYAEMQDRQKGTFYGLGILVTKRNDQVTVITPLEGTPASRLGIRAGDIIAEVEGQPTEGIPLDDVVQKLKGPKGTTVHIKIRRVGIKDLIPMSIVREAIPTNSISSAIMVRPGVGYIRIKDFTYTTVREMDEALAKLEGQGMKSLVLDLRMNPGGLLDAAVGTADFFLDKGQMIVYHKGRTPDSYEEYRAPGTHRHIGVPLVVLVNHESASASEIVSGAMQDHDRGLVVGETSWGKGLVQSVYSLQYGAGLALTTSRYYTPSGRNIQRDYSSFYDYYFGDSGNEDATAHVYKTDLGRKVYGGGGITPDVVVKPRTLPRVIQILQVRSALFNYGVRYAADHPDVKIDMKVDDGILDDFIKYCVKGKMAPEADIQAAIKDPANAEYLKHALEAEIVSAKFGYDASYPIRLESDEQVARAIEELPKAAKLEARAETVREQKIATKEDKASTGESADGSVKKK